MGGKTFEDLTRIAYSKNKKLTDNKKYYERQGVRGVLLQGNFWAKLQDDASSSSNIDDWGNTKVPLGIDSISSLHPEMENNDRDGGPQSPGIST